MKLFLLALLTCAFSFSSSAAFITTTSIEAKIEIAPAPTVISLAALSAKQLEQYLGRKLTLTEKVRWYFGKKALAKLQTEEEDQVIKKGRTNAFLGFGFSIVSLFFFPLAIAGIIFSNNALKLDKEKPGILTDAKGFAQAGQIIGWVAIGLGILSILALIAILSWWAGLG